MLPGNVQPLFHLCYVVGQFAMAAFSMALEAIKQAKDLLPFG